MTRATHFDRGWSGHKMAACGSWTSELGTNVTRNTRLVDCKRCRAIIEWRPPVPESSVKPVERRATVAASDSLRSTAQAVVDRWNEWDMSPKTDGYEWHRLEAAIGELSAALGKDGG